MCTGKFVVSGVVWFWCVPSLISSDFQGMDAVTRQTGQHIEFEPEWEQAFNLQLKLADSISVMIEWCATDVSDHIILIYVYIRVIIGVSCLIFMI